MADNVIQIESVTENVQSKVKQSFKFKTAKFVWRIKFTAPLDPSTVNNKNLYVTNLNQMPLKTYIRYDSINQYIEIEPLEPYSSNESYILTITRDVKSKGGKNLKTPVALRFRMPN